MSFRRIHCNLWTFNNHERLQKTSWKTGSFHNPYSVFFWFVSPRHVVGRWKEGPTILCFDFSIIGYIVCMCVCVCIVCIVDTTKIGYILAIFAQAVLVWRVAECRRVPESISRIMVCLIPPWLGFMLAFLVDVYFAWKYVGKSRI